MEITSRDTMGEMDVNLFPEDRLPVRDFGIRARRALTELRIIDGYYEEEEDLLAAGPNSLKAFPGDADYMVGFEYCSVYDFENADLVPGMPALEPRCPHCDADIDETYYSTLDESGLYELPRGRADFMKIQFICPVCERDIRLPELESNSGLLLLKQHIDFHQVVDYIKPAWVDRIARRMGCRLAIRSYGYT
ncbi:MAG: hypothetical protein NXI24_24690 [bacterium]|nr:hypothetical protein [bacterium]